MKLEDCKVGMKVQALRRGPKNLADWKSSCKECSDQIATISNIYEAYVDTSVQLGYCWFNPENLKLYEEKPMKYKELKPITTENIMAYTPPHKDLGEYIGQFGYGKANPDELIGYAELHQHSCWKGWLIDHGFIEEVKEKKTYHVGQRFYIPGGIGDEYLLAMVGNFQVSLISPDGTSCWSRRPIKVNGVWGITEDELNELGGSYKPELIE